MERKENLWDKELWTQKEVAGYFRVVSGTVKNWKSKVCYGIGRHLDHPRYYTIVMTSGHLGMSTHFQRKAVIKKGLKSRW